MMGRRWKYWDGSIKGHLWNKTSVKLYLFQGIGVFLICVLLYPRSRLIGSAAVGRPAGCPPGPAPATQR